MSVSQEGRLFKFDIVKPLSKSNGARGRRPNFVFWVTGSVLFVSGWAFNGGWVGNFRVKKNKSSGAQFLVHLVENFSECVHHKKNAHLVRLFPETVHNILHLEQAFFDCKTCQIITLQGNINYYSKTYRKYSIRSFSE